MPQVFKVYGQTIIISDDSCRLRYLRPSCEIFLADFENTNCRAVAYCLRLLRCHRTRRPSDEPKPPNTALSLTNLLR